MPSSTKAKRTRRPFPGAFSLVEIIFCVAVLAVLATIAVSMMTPSVRGVSNARLETDVLKLNQLIGIYLAQGGNLNGVTTAQDVLDRLKITTADAQRKTQVGVQTGRSLDVRLTARALTQDKIPAGGTLAAVWNNQTQRFELKKVTSISNTTVGEFYLNESLAGSNYGSHTRADTNIKYNSGDGWVWNTGDAAPQASVTPAPVSLTDMTNNFDPGMLVGTTSSTSTSTSTTSTSTTSTSTTSTSTTSTSTTSSSTTTGGTTSTPQTIALPTPIISPPGGIYFQTLFPSQVYINANGAPGGSSRLMYKIDNGDWIAYTTPFDVKSGNKVEAKNFSTAPLVYRDSETRTEKYYFLVPAFTGLVTAKWNPSVGPSTMRSTINNANADSVNEQNGTAASGSTRNSFTFNRRANFINVPPDKEFVIGQIVYRNGTINSGTGATALRLHLDITMTTPGVASTPADINMDLENTVNSGGGGNDDADYCILANPVTNYTINLNGVNYTLVVRYGTIAASQGYVEGNTLAVWEGSTGTVDIIGSFVSSAP